MAVVTLRESLRRKKPVFTNADRHELIDELLLERFTPPEPTLAELHSMWVEALQERDRLQDIGRDAEEALANLRQRTKDRIADQPTLAQRFTAEFERAAQPHQERLSDAEAALVELNASVDWSVLEAGEKKFQQTVNAAMKAHNAARLVNAKAVHDKARAKHDAARAEITDELNYTDLVNAVKAAGEAEVALRMAARTLAAVERAVKGK